MDVCINMFVSILSFKFLFKCVLEAQAFADSYHAVLMTEEIHLNSAIAVRPNLNPKALIWKWRQNWIFKVNVQTLDAPISANKVLNRGLL